MKSFFLRSLLAAFIECIIVFCNQNGIGNIPQRPMSRDELEFVVPMSILTFVGLSYIFYRPGKK